MKPSLLAFFVGVLFSLGLSLSGMTDPERVLGFLDISGRWDPALIFVMASAIPVYFLAWQFMKRKNKPYFDHRMHVPTRKDIDQKLLIGSAIFGIGWGIGGICPGPGIAALGAKSMGALVFVICFFIGSKIESLVRVR